MLRFHVCAASQHPGLAKGTGKSRLWGRFLRRVPGKRGYPGLLAPGRTMNSQPTPRTQPSCVSEALTAQVGGG